MYIKNCDDLLIKIRNNYFIILGLIFIFFILLIIITNIEKNTVILISYFIFSFIICCMCLTKYFSLKNKIYDKKSIIDKELANVEFHANDYLLTENYIIGLSNFSLINYNDILLIHDPILLGGNISYTKRVYIITKTGKVYSFCYSDSRLSEDAYKSDLIEFLKMKNNSIMIGANKKNKEILKNKYNIKLRFYWKW